jgi:hypothetical protein
MTNTSALTKKRQALEEWGLALKKVWVNRVKLKKLWRLRRLLPGSGDCLRNPRPPVSSCSDAQASLTPAADVLGKEFPPATVFPELRKGQSQGQNQGLGHHLKLVFGAPVLPITAVYRHHPWQHAQGFASGRRSVASGTPVRLDLAATVKLCVGAISEKACVLLSFERGWTRTF